jgi:hypothetical protein
MFVLHLFVVWLALTLVIGMLVRLFSPLWFMAQATAVCLAYRHARKHTMPPPQEPRGFAVLPDSSDPLERFSTTDHTDFTDKI